MTFYLRYILAQPSNFQYKKLKDGLNKTSENLSEGFKDVFVRKKLDDEMLENLEEVLISSDMGIETALSLTEQLRQEKFEKDITEEEVKTFFAGKIAQNW